MKKKNRLWIGISLLCAFVLWTVALCYVDVQPIGPGGSPVGFAGINRAFHRKTGVHLSLYHITDWLGLIPLAFAFGFAFLGLIQWIRRRRLCRVDLSLFVLGGFYLVVLGVFLFFEGCVINYRPVLLGSLPEASYPSSTTLLTMCVIPTAMLQLRGRIKKPILRNTVLVLMGLFLLFMVVGRLVSGVHWLSDIVGGALLSAGLVCVYYFFSKTEKST